MNRIYNTLQSGAIRIKPSKSKSQSISAAQKVKFRVMVLQALQDKEIDRATASARIGVTLRQLSRLQTRYKSEGEAGLFHRLIGKSSNNSGDDEMRSKVIGLYKTQYLGFNYVHASELLERRDGIKIHPNTLRYYLLNAGITKPQKKHKEYHKRRQPRERFGELVQMDGSFHDWFGDGQMLCLMHMVDDATGTSLAMVFDGETTNAALHILHKWCTLYGIPDALYTDKDSVYRVNEKQALSIEEELAGDEQKLTEFGKVCQRLNIDIIYAHSPQAKGRVERKHAIYQDRFVKEIRLLGLSSVPEINDYLLKPDGFTANINAQFTIPARNSAATCLKLPPEKLSGYFTIDSSRMVRNDYTISFRNQVYQLERNCSAVNAKSKVTVKIHLDGEMSIHSGVHQLKYSKVDNYQQPVKSQPKKAANTAPTQKIKIKTPWRTKPSETPRNKRRPTTSENLDSMYRNYV